MRFQSTLPVWGATDVAIVTPPQLCISIHAPRVGSDTSRLQDTLRTLLISIHAPRVGSDLLLVCLAHFIDISIHAPRVGSD